MAQLGDLARARLLLRRAAAAFGPREAIARARCITAEAEIALVCRDLGWTLKPLDAAYASSPWRSPQRRACALFESPLSASDRTTGRGFALCPRAAHDLVVLTPLTDEANAHVLALLGDGESWSSSALALALRASQRTVQRALDELLAADKVQAVGKARGARRWMAPPVPGFLTSLLLPAALPSG